jgi:hypothetical protein
VCTNEGRVHEAICPIQVPTTSQCCSTCHTPLLPTTLAPWCIGPRTLLVSAAAGESPLTTRTQPPSVRLLPVEQVLSLPVPLRLCFLATWAAWSEYTPNKLPPHLRLCARASILCLAWLCNLYVGVRAPSWVGAAFCLAALALACWRVCSPGFPRCLLLDWFR